MDAELAIIVADAYQHRGLGSQLVSQMIALARAENLNRMICQINADNQPMLVICQRRGFQFTGSGADNSRIAILTL
jgi:acetyltransferase